MSEDKRPGMYCCMHAAITLLLYASHQASIKYDDDVLMRHQSAARAV